MKIRQIINNITENWSVKAACFVLAIFIYIFFQLSIQETKTFVVNLDIVSKNGMAVTNNYQKKIKISIRGKKEDIAIFRESEVSAYVDLSFLAKEGSYKVPILVDLPKDALLLDALEVKVSPQEIPITVEEEIKGFVSLNPLVKGEVADGYEIKTIKITPDEVEIFGPKSIVQNYNRLQTKAINVKGANTSFSKNVGVDNLGKSLKLVSKELINVEVEIVPSVSSKKIIVNSLSCVGLPETLQVENENIEVEFVVTGKKLDIDNLKNTDFIVEADFSKITNIETESFVDVPIKIIKPEKVEFKGEYPKKISLQLKKIESEDTEIVEDVLPKIEDLKITQPEEVETITTEESIKS